MMTQLSQADGLRVAFTDGALRVAPWLARLKFLRGTPLDPFGYSAHRKLERRLIRDYEARIRELLAELSSHNLDVAVDIASLPEQVRGFEDDLEGDALCGAADFAQLGGYRREPTFEE